MKTEANINLDNNDLRPQNGKCSRSKVVCEDVKNWHYLSITNFK